SRGCGAASRACRLARGAGPAALPAWRRPHWPRQRALSRSLPRLEQGRRPRRNAERQFRIPRGLGQHSALDSWRGRGAAAPLGRPPLNRPCAPTDRSLSQKEQRRTPACSRRPPCVASTVCLVTLRLRRSFLLLLVEGFGAFLELCRRHVLLVGGDVPGVAGGVLQTASA